MFAAPISPLRRPLSSSRPTRRGVRLCSSVGGTQVVVAGAGIAGLATAVALHNAGISVRVLEAGSSLRQEGSAIGLWDNAWRALDELGVADSLRPSYLPLNVVELCRGESGRTLRRFNFSECEGGAGSEFRGVHRSGLLQALAAALPQGTIRFGCSVDTIREQPGGASVGTSGSVTEKSECSLLVGADGVRSAVARHLGLGPPRYSGYSAVRGVAHLGSGGLASIELPPTTIRQIWGAGVRVGLYPLNDQEVYWFVCFNADEAAADASSPEAHIAEALALVPGWAWHIEEVIKATPAAQISRSRIADRWNVAPWGRGCITLAGDAAHPMTPNLGQGGCTALEDAVLLAAEVGPVLRGAGQQAGGAELAAALRRYEQRRSARCLPLTIKSNLMGVALQSGLGPMCLARDWFVSSPLFSPAHFLDSCNYNVSAEAALTKR